MVMLIGLCLLCQLTAVCDAARQALVIGNGDYEDTPLQNPINDANAMTAVLQKLDFTVFTEINVNQQAMEAALRNFGQQLQPGDTALFYFSGHGAQVDGVNYLLPIGARIGSEQEIKYNAVEAGLMLDQMAQARCRLNIVILDACRNNPFKGFASNRGGLAFMAAPTGTLIAYATAPGTTAYDGQEEHSPYTKHLLAALAKPGLRVEDVFKQARVGVMVETDYKQVPWESSSLIGDFYFTAETAAQPQPEVTPTQPEPVATPAPTIAHAQPLVLIAPGKGAGDLAIGLSAEQAQALLGEPETVTDLYQDGKMLYWEYPAQGLMVQIEAGQVQTIHMYSGLDGGYDEKRFQPFAGATAEGVDVHATEAEVLNIYGEPLDIDIDPYDSGLLTKRVYYDGISFKFVKETGQMIRMWVSGRSPQNER